MRRLLSVCDDALSMEKFGCDRRNVERFLDANGFDGLELMRWDPPPENAVPAERVIGRHLPFWPMWLDFWRGDREALIRQFGSEETAAWYYCAGSRQEFIELNRRFLTDAIAMGARYAVMHVSHSTLEDAYRRQGFSCGEEAIVDAFVDFVNEMAEGVDPGCALLFENHWYPGLTLLDPGAAQRLLHGVRWPDTGFVLDVGHMMQTADLEGERDAAAYILRVLDGLGPVRDRIRAVHLNSSLTGQALRDAYAHAAYQAEDSFYDRLVAALKHVGGIDRHHPFRHPDIQKVIAAAAPEFLVYELAADTLKDLQAAVQAQSGALGFDIQPKPR